MGPSRLVFFLAALVLVSEVSWAATEETFMCRELAGRSAPSAPMIDGDLSDPAWQAAEVSEQMTQLYPDPGGQPTFSTRIQVLYDADALYIAAHCRDSHPEQIVARVTRRDRKIDSDWFQVEIDSRMDHRSGYFFATNAAGVQWDGTLFDENQESPDWDGVWEAASRIVDDGWMVEMRIPLCLLRFQSAEQVRFGVNFTRNISRLNEIVQWQYIAPDSSLRVSRFGLLTELALAKTPRHIELTPYFALRPYAEPTHISQRLFDVGADAKLSLGPDFKLTLTANPDFGQVEVDQVVLNLSTIETYFPEKRPFFLEDRQLFRMSRFGDDGPRAELFYTRRIGRAPRSVELADGEELVQPTHLPRIYGAAKLAGRSSGRLSVGLLQAVSSAESARVQPVLGGVENRLAEPLSSFSILRLAQGFGQNSTVGLMATAMATPDAGHAITGGGNLELSLREGAYHLSLKTFFSHLSSERFGWHDDFVRTALEQEGPTGYGAALFLFKKSGRHLVGGLGGGYRSSNLALNDLGYLDRPDMASAFVWAQFRHLEPWGPLAQVRINANAWFFRNTDWRNIGDGISFNGHQQFVNKWIWDWYLEYKPPQCDDRETRTAGAVVSCESKDHVEAFVRVGSDPGRLFSAQVELAAANTERGWIGKVGLPLSLLPSDRLQLELILGYRRALGRIRWIDVQELGDEDRHLFAQQHSEYWDLVLRGTFTATTQLSFQLYGQVFLAAVDHGQKLAGPVGATHTIHLPDLLPAPDVADDYDYTATIFNLSAVLRWEYQPGSVAYLVYTGSSDQSLELSDFRFASVMGDLMAHVPEHTVMLKLSYLWT